MQLPKKFAQTSRKVFYFIHLWTGLLLGVWLVLMGLTGSILSWKYELIEWEARQRVSAPVPQPGHEIIPASKAIAALKAFDADLTPERNLYLPVSPTGYYWHSARTRVNGERVSQVYLVHPITAKVYPPVIQTTLWVDVTEKFHHNLLIGVKGTVTNGFLTFFTLFMLISGLWLWWPSNLKQLKLRLWFKSRASLKRQLYDLHNMMGMYLYGLLFVITLTGVLICYNGQTDQSVTKGINQLAGVPEKPRSRGGRRGNEIPSLAAKAAHQTPLSVDAMIEKAQLALPHNKVTAISWPRHPGQPFKASYEFVRITNDGVPFDPYSGERLYSVPSAAFGRAPSPGTKAMGAVFHLHYGWFGGFWIKVLYCISGFLPLGLFITGVWMWLKKKRSQARNRIKAQQRAEQLVVSPPEPIETIDSSLSNTC